MARHCWIYVCVECGVYEKRECVNCGLTVESRMGKRRWRHTFITRNGRNLKSSKVPECEPKHGV